MSTNPTNGGEAPAPTPDTPSETETTEVETPAEAPKARKTRAKKATADKAPAKRGPKAMTDEHKEALAKGRQEGRAVRAYLEALATNKPKRGRPRTLATVEARLDAVKKELETADPIQRLSLTQEQMDLEAEVASFGEPIDMEALTGAFVEVAASYAQRKDISYAAFRTVGVPAAVLKAAGITRS